MGERLFYIPGEITTTFDPVVEEVWVQPELQPPHPTLDELVSDQE